MRCGQPAVRLCDWKLAYKKTCDAPLCATCTYEPADGKDLCPRHRQKWLEFKSIRESARNENRN